MTPHEYRKLLAGIGRSQGWAGRHLATETTGRRWGSGVSAVPRSALVVLRLLELGKISPGDVERVSGVEEPEGAVVHRKREAKAKKLAKPPA